MLYLSLFVSAVGVAGLWLVMRNPKYGFFHYLFVGGAVVALPCVCLFALPGVWYSMAVAILLAVGWHFTGRRRAAAIPVLLLALVVGHAIPFFVTVWPEMRTRTELRNEVVVLDLNDRLPRPAVPAVPAVLRIEGLADLDAAVTKLWPAGERRWQFARLHGQTVDAFVSSPGFGVTRMSEGAPSRERYLPTRRPIDQPSRDVTSQARPAVEHPASDRPAEFSGYHARAVLEFAFPFGWGWERTPSEFLGFQPHQFGELAKYEYGSVKWSPGAGGGWRVASLDLIGLVVHPKPTVYLTDHLPRMDEAKAAPTRDPDEFEAAGLKSVAGGEPLYVGRSRTEAVLRMVGGIRAAKACTSCHACREGELLGAFSYVLTK